MLNVYEDRESRRFTILEGISKDLSYSDIATQLGVNRWTIHCDIRKMQHERDRTQTDVPEEKGIDQG